AGGQPQVTRVPALILIETVDRAHDREYLVIVRPRGDLIDTAAGERLHVGGDLGGRGDGNRGIGRTARTTRHAAQRGPLRINDAAHRELRLRSENRDLIDEQRHALIENVERAGIVRVEQRTGLGIGRGISGGGHAYRGVVTIYVTQQLENRG